MTKDEKDCLAESRVVTFQDGRSLSEEEKIRLDLLANCIIEDSERVTIPDNDTQALRLENARLVKQSADNFSRAEKAELETTRLRIKCEEYKQALKKLDERLDLLHRSVCRTLEL